MSKASVSPHRAHPDYSEGYFSALEGGGAQPGRSEAYRHGVEAGRRAVEVFREHGFAPDARGGFSTRLSMEG